MYKRIVVPLDGSDLARHALTDAAEIARLSHAPIHLVRVIDLTQLDRYGLYGFGGGGAAFQSLVDEEVEAAAADLEKIATDLRNQGLMVTTEVRRGGVVFELQQVAQPGDLYVIASHGRGGISRWFLGSVAEELVRRSVVPILIVRVLTPNAAATAGNGVAAVHA
jgi:nucleotide-binding universal stress UspA family protein